MDSKCKGDISDTVKRDNLSAISLLITAPTFFGGSFFVIQISYERRAEHAAQTHTLAVCSSAFSRANALLQLRWRDLSADGRTMRTDPVKETGLPVFQERSIAGSAEAAKKNLNAI